MALYLVLVLLALFSGVQLFDDAYTILGWALIGIFMTAALLNTLVILSYAISHFKKVLIGQQRSSWRHKKKQKTRKRGKIAPIPLSISKTDPNEGRLYDDEVHMEDFLRQANSTLEGSLS